MLGQEDLRDACVLLLANKQDMSVMGVPQITERLELHTLRNRKWFIQGTCALTGDGLTDGMDWLSKVIIKKK